MLWRLWGLKSISLAHNCLVALPLPVLLSSVTALDLSYNKITALRVESEEDACARVADSEGRGSGEGGGGRGQGVDEVAGGLWRAGFLQVVACVM